MENNSNESGKPRETTVAPTITTSTTTPGTVTIAPTTTSAPTATTVQTAQTSTPRQTIDNTKEECRKFLANLLKLSSQEPKAVERNVRTLIQELIDTKVEPEEFCDRLEKLLNASPQPWLIGFLKKNLPLLRQSLVTKELVIEGIKPPPANVVFSIASAVPAITTVAPTITISTTTPGTVTTAPTTTSAPTATTVQTAQTSTPRQTTDNTKEKCRKFLANLLELSSQEPKAVERNVQTLIQELIDTKVEPEEFCDRLEKLINVSPQPCLIGFLKESLPLLRQIV